MGAWSFLETRCSSCRSRWCKKTEAFLAWILCSIQFPLFRALLPFIYFLGFICLGGSGGLGASVGSHNIVGGGRRVPVQGREALGGGGGGV